MGVPIAFNLDDAAACMQVTRKHVYHLINTDLTFPRSFKVGGCTRILRVELEDWLANKAKQAREMQVARQAKQAQKREAVRAAVTSVGNASSAETPSLSRMVQHKEVKKRPPAKHPLKGE